MLPALSIRRFSWPTLHAIRGVQALENDLIFECFHTDLGVGD